VLLVLPDMDTLVLLVLLVPLALLALLGAPVMLDLLVLKATRVLPGPPAMVTPDPLVKLVLLGLLDMDMLDLLVPLVLPE